MEDKLKPYREAVYVGYDKAADNGDQSCICFREGTRIVGMVHGELADIIHDLLQTRTPEKQSTPCEACKDSGVVATTDKDQDGNTVEARCPLCEKGFPVEQGFHYGTQAKGMIQATKCEKQSTPEELREAVDEAQGSVACADQQGWEVASVNKDALKTLIHHATRADGGEVVTVDYFEEWLGDRMNECARAGITEGDMPEQLAKDFFEKFHNGLRIVKGGG